MNRVYDSKAKQTIFRCDTLQEAVDWLMERKDQYDRYGTYVDEVDENDTILGWWELDDLINDLGE